MRDREQGPIPLAIAGRGTVLTLIFLGTRGNTRITSPLHRRHSSLQVKHQRHNVMIDCGTDWHDDVWTINPTAIVLTHAHPDHAFGLNDGSPCTVYATAETWQGIAGFDIAVRQVVSTTEPFDLAGIQFRAVPVEHSTRAPAVGFRISAGGATCFYVPDVVYIPDRSAALVGVSLNVGDGATLTRSMVRKPDSRLVGHTPVSTQLAWCGKENVPRALFTHCGSDIIRRDAVDVHRRVGSLGAERGVQADVAIDGLEITLD